MCEFIGNTDGGCSIHCKMSWNANEKKMFCDNFMGNNPEEAEKIIMDWAKEHPAVTNADKFKEVFGMDPDTSNCPITCMGCDGCEYLNFWEQEYQEPKRDKE